MHPLARFATPTKSNRIKLVESVEKMAVPESGLDAEAGETVTTKANNEHKSSKKAILVSQEIKLAKVLAGNNKKLRDKALKGLKKWFQNRSQTMPFTEEDFMCIWKGLFYSMWMSDKPLIQEECAENISRLIHFPAALDSILFFKCSLRTLINEWFGIDQLRLDKFLMLTRRMLRQGFCMLKKNKWDRKLIEKFNDVLTETILNTQKQPPIGLALHFTDIYLEELAKVSDGGLHEHTVTIIIKPFVRQIALLNDNRQLDHIRKHIFHYLLKQSDAGQEYEEKFSAWKMQGYPGGTMDALQKVEIPEDERMSDDEDESAEEEVAHNVLDPRAGRVDVILPQLKFNAKHVIDLLQQFKFIQGSTAKSRKVITKLMEEFQQLTKGVFPLGLKKVELPKYDGYSMSLKKSVNRLAKFENKLLGFDKKNRKRKLDNPDWKSSVKKSKLTNGLQNGDDFNVMKEKCDLDKSSSKKIKRKLENIHQESSGKRKCKEKLDDIETTNEFVNKNLSSEKYDFKFKRNSGTWFVINEETTGSPSLLSTSLNVHTDKSSPIQSIKSSPKQVSPITISTPKKPKGSFKKSTPNGNADVFPQNEWDAPLKDGEDEFFIPSKKYKGKISMKSPRLVSNPFANNKTPSSQSNSSKKVNINLKLNRSQEIHEHHAQLKNSPGIPFDATKKPEKPLLKHTSVNSPINPFYKRKLKL